MGRHYGQPSAEERGTILRELRRNGDQLGRCTPVMGRPLRLPSYDARRLLCKRRVVRKLNRHGPLWAEVAHRLQLKWSPQQIAGRLKSVSHETIYTAIYAMPRGTLRRELTRLMRQGSARRRLRMSGYAPAIGKAI